MPRKPVIIGDIKFDKKGDALLFFKTMLNKYSPGERVSDEDGEVLSIALNNHPDAVKKVGVGIFYFSVGKADFGTQCFWVNRTDGSSEKFSYISCLK